MTEQFLLVGLLGAAVGAISLTITRSKLFRPFRMALMAAESAAPVGSWLEIIFGFLHELSRCCYCISHWVAIAAYFTYHPVLIQQPVLNAFLVIFLLVSLSTPVAWMLFTCASAVEPAEDS